MVITFGRAACCVWLAAASIFGITSAMEITTHIEQCAILMDACTITSATYNSLQEHSNAIKAAIEAGAPINGICLADGQLLAPVLFAALAGDPCLMEWLLARGASTNVGNNNYPSPLHAVFNTLESPHDIAQHFCKKLPYSQEAILVQQLTNGLPLLLAAQTGNEKLALRCIEYGLNINAQDARGRTALMLAVAHKQYAIIDILLEYGADGTIPDKDAQTALDYASEMFDATRASRIQNIKPFAHTKIPLQYNTGSAEDLRIAQEIIDAHAELLAQLPTRQSSRIQTSKPIPAPKTAVATRSLKKPEKNPTLTKRQKKDTL